MANLTDIRAALRDNHLRNEADVLQDLTQQFAPTAV